MNKSAIVVYNPSDPWERAIQDTAKDILGQWLPSFACQSVAAAIANLKSIDDWMDNPRLYGARARYFFSPQFCSRKSQMVFVTHPLYLRDILENHEIDAFLHDPITFVTRPIAHYLMREYPIHVFVDYERLKADNRNVKFVDVGGLLISQGKSLILSEEAILDIKSLPSTNVQFPNQYQAVRQRKAASKSISRGVFKIDEHNRILMPKMQVYDKEKRSNGEIYLVEPGDTGIVGVVYEDGSQITVSKLFFDTRYAVV